MIDLIGVAVVFSFVMYKVITAPQSEQVYIKYEDDINLQDLEHERRMRDIRFYQERAWIDSLNKDK